MAKKKSQLEKAIEAIDVDIAAVNKRAADEIAVLQQARYRLVTQQQKTAAKRKPKAIEAAAAQFGEPCDARR